MSETGRSRKPCARSVAESRRSANADPMRIIELYARSVTVSTEPPAALRQALQDLLDRGAPAGIHGRVAHGVLRRLGLAQVLHQIEKLGRRLRLEGHHEILIVQA